MAELTEEQERIKELYERYYKNRDFEINRFWENSKFIWGLYAVCFTVYGILFKEKDIMCDDILMIGIALVGILISWIWLKMSQGCKAWVEVYEIAIWTLDRENKMKYPATMLIENFTLLKDYKNKDRFMKSDAISPTKIIIAICHIMILLWIIMATIPIIRTIINYIPCDSTPYSKIIIVFICIYFPMEFIIRYNTRLFQLGEEIRSSSLNSLQYQIVDELRKLNPIRIDDNYAIITNNVNCNWISEIDKEIKGYILSIPISEVFCKKIITDQELTEKLKGKIKEHTISEVKQTITELKITFEN